MRVVFFEDDLASQFAPIALMRPVCELLCGCFSIRERVLRERATNAWGAIVRPELQAVYAEEHPTAKICDPFSGHLDELLLVNARWLGDAKTLDKSTGHNVGLIEDQIAWLTIGPEDAARLRDDDWNEFIPQIVARRTEQVRADGVMLERPWDLIAQNAKQIVADFDSFEPESSLPDHVAVVGDKSHLSIAPSAEIDPFVVLDVRHGPIRIEPRARVQSFTKIEGPAFIGSESQLFRALVRAGTSIGPVCRVGGEIEESIFQGYANKYHDGFLGHSFVCPWVNIGAMTSTSDLKNDYSNVKVPLEGTPIDSGSSKIGSFIGDHTKTAINSMFNTGSSIGVMAMVLPGGPLLPKFIPSFSMVWFGQLREGWGPERSIETARVAMSRRGQNLSEAQAALIRHLHGQTVATRAMAVMRDKQQAAG